MTLFRSFTRILAVLAPAGLCAIAPRAHAEAAAAPPLDARAQLASDSELAFRNYADAYEAVLELQASVNAFIADPADDSEEALTQAASSTSRDATLNTSHARSFVDVPLRLDLRTL